MCSRIKIFFFLILSLVSGRVVGQIPFMPRSLVEFIEFLDLRNRINPQEPDYDGSPFLNDEFVNGDVYYNNEFVIRNVPLRYDMQNDEMQYTYRNYTFAFGPNPRLNFIIIQSDTFVIETIQPRSADSLGFFKLIIPGKLTILAHLSVSYREGRPPGALEDRAVPAKFTRRPDEYYAKIEGSVPEKIRSMDKLIELLSDHQAELTRFWKSNKSSPNKANDLILFAGYYNSLQP
ncbi:MAG TPA: hypothetical protein VI583_11595 [Cyclobacteriaceae bacterium]|nr:hypothetical protein [Cyclobacteriaceae bacterium]